MFPRTIRSAVMAACLSLTPLFNAEGQESSALSGIVESWLNSPHADPASEAFRHWNEDGAIPPTCAGCHSSPGLRDLLGGDGTAAGVVDHPALIGSTVDCAACHGLAATDLRQVTFPSGAVATDLGVSAVCVVCHQGRQSSGDLDDAVAGKGEDAVSPELSFVNVHYRAAAASLMGSAAHGGYEYPGKTYAGRYAHVRGLDNCAGCHDPHGLDVDAARCARCHGAAGLAAIRNDPRDTDGDGDSTEGVAGEVATLHEWLGHAISAYAREVAGAAIAYAPDAYPYFFADLDGNGVADGEERGYPNRYMQWTPRLLKAAYNYQFVAKDPGIYAHNPVYARQILIDSLESLGGVVAIGRNGWTRP